jgi:hypothetical protein
LHIIFVSKVNKRSKHTTGSISNHGAYQYIFFRRARTTKTQGYQAADASYWSRSISSGHPARLLLFDVPCCEKPKGRRAPRFVGIRFAGLASSYHEERAQSSFVSSSGRCCCWVPSTPTITIRPCCAAAGLVPVSRMFWSTGGIAIQTISRRRDLQEAISS